MIIQHSPSGKEGKGIPSRGTVYADVLRYERIMCLKQSKRSRGDEYVGESDRELDMGRGWAEVSPI